MLLAAVCKSSSSEWDGGGGIAVALRCYGGVGVSLERWWMAILALCQILGVALKAGKG